MRNVLFAAILATVFGTGLMATDVPEKFSDRVRSDFFNGFQGDEEALARGLKICEETLAKNPKHAEAMVWRGAGRVFQSGQQFQKKNMVEGMKLWTTGHKDLDEAVALAPDSIGVRIPRAATLLPASRGAPPAMGKPLLTKALDDFQTIYKKQEKELDKLGTHPRGELRMGLADVYRALGESDKSKEQLEAVIKEIPQSKYAARAKEWLAAPADAKLAHSCIGCHGK